ncbi:Prostasin [Frankliniella fusca]|uniref:Prostasin n=1 Tax=Frankliniella fusca TaxID=407009 RepID=A0AAE1H546_9NEOP|nr:Prostasin [Frankliniella fusca]
MHRCGSIAVLLLLVLAALTGAHGAQLPLSSDIEPFISGGTETDNGHLVYIVELIKAPKFINKPAEHLGAGTLLTKDWVLTTVAAAPELPWMEAWKHVLVAVGRADGSDGIQFEIDDKKSAIEPTNGILKLLKLTKSVELNASTRPANLPSSSTVSAGLPAILAGWGSDGKKLNSVSVTVLAREKCVAEGMSSLPDDQICTSTEGNACKGDDGAPLVVDRGTGAFRVVGIATGTDKQSDKCDERSAYVNVAMYTSWILNTLYQ